MLIIFVATTGLLDSMPVQRCAPLRKGISAIRRNQHSVILKTIAEKKALDDAIKAEIKKVVGEFKQRFTTSDKEAVAAAK